LISIEVTGAAVTRFSRREIAEFVRRVLLVLDRLHRIPSEISDVSIAIVDDEAMRNLNRKFRKKNKTTDVLTFPADDSYADPNAQGRPLGDIVISVDQARRQAVEQKHSLVTEIRYLILHGILHALGYDHETDDGAMNELEAEVRAAVGLE
jgi:metalloprotein, YbeY/UPF0054 family